MNEYVFKRDTTMADFLPWYEVDRLRDRYSADSYACACDIWRMLSGRNIQCTVVVFSAVGGIGVRDYNNSCYWFCQQHAVVLLGKYIIDILHSDRLMPTSEYVKNLDNVNSGLYVVEGASGSWYDSEGWKVKVTVNKLISGNWG